MDTSWEWEINFVFFRHPGSVQFSSVQLLSHVWLFVIPWAAAQQIFLSYVISWSWLKLMFIEWMVPSVVLILCCLLLIIIIIESLSDVQLFMTPWTVAHQACLYFTISWSLHKLMSSESVMPSNHLILCCPFSSCLQSYLSISFSNELVLCIR